MNEFFNAIITYTIEDTDRRNAFTDYLEKIGCEKQEDQSTYGVPLHVIGTYTKINEYCKKNLKKTDSVHLYRSYKASDEDRECIKMIKILTS